MKKGIDVSKWQKEIDWRKVKADGISFAIIRLGYGSSAGKRITVDEYFHKNMVGALSAGLSVGVYFYTYAKSTAAAKGEAALVIKQMKRYKGKIGYPIWYDIEDKNQLALDKWTRTAMCRFFCNALEDAGYYAGIYASKDWFVNKLGKLDDYDKWVAQYNKICDYAGSKGMWQYTSNGVVSGVRGRCDLNYAYKDYPAIMRKTKLNGVK